jgi:hypothetical protein
MDTSLSALGCLDSCSTLCNAYTLSTYTYPTSGNVAGSWIVATR